MSFLCGNPLVVMAVSGMNLTEMTYELLTRSDQYCERCEEPEFL